MVSVSVREQVATVRAWETRIAPGFPLWVDPEGRGLAAFRVPGHPSTVLIDRQGRVVARFPGERKWDTPAARRLLTWLMDQGQP